MLLKCLLIIASILLSSSAEARFRHGRGLGPGYYGGHWHDGYWFHGAYRGYAGWWWVVGPAWYYYPGPVYPYPPEGAEPVYVVQAANAPPVAPPPNSPNVAVGSTSPAPLPSAPAHAKASAPTGKPQAFSYYCAKTKNYYPVTKECPEGWIASEVKPPN